MKNNCIFQYKKNGRKSGTVLHISLMFVSRELILLSASAFNLLQYVVFVEVYEENSASYKCIVRKGRNILITFADNC